MQIHSFDAVISEKGAAIQEVIFLDSSILKSLIIELKSESPILLLSKSLSHLLLQKSRQINELEAAVEEYSSITEVSELSPAGFCSAPFFLILDKSFVIYKKNLGWV